MKAAITRNDFTLSRTPSQLTSYVQTTYNQIASDSELRKKARLKIEPYKTFLEELLPFSLFCTWKYGNCSSVLCALTSATSRHGTPNHDAEIIENPSSVHAVELTWPINGKEMNKQAVKMNAEGFGPIIEFDFNDTSIHEAAIQQTIDIALKKSIRNYHCSGGSSLIFIFDRCFFWNENPRHRELLTTLETKLAAINFLADHVLLMLLHGTEVKIRYIKPPSTKT